MGSVLSEVNIGVVGTGIGEFHITAIANLMSDLAERRARKESNVPDILLAAICDNALDGQERARLALKKAGIYNTTFPIFSDLTKMLQSGTVNAVTLAVPNYLHHKMAISAMRAGCHVLIEKPLANSITNAAALVDTASNYTGLIVAMMMNNLHRADYALVREKLDDGEVGRIQRVNVYWERGCGIPHRGQWFTQKARSGGGPVIDLAPHMLGLLLDVTDWQMPAQLHGWTWSNFATGGGNGCYGGGTRTPRVHMDVEDSALAYMTFPHIDGGPPIVAECRVSWATHGVARERFGLEVIGSKGALLWSSVWPKNDDGKTEDKIELIRTGNSITVANVNADENPTNQDEDMGRKANVQAFALHCAGVKAPALFEMENALLVQTIIDGWYKSAETGVPFVFSDA